MKADLQSGQLHPIDYLGVRVDKQSISLMDGRHRLVVIPMAEIVRIEILLGSDVKHPIILFLFGIGLIGLGLSPFLSVYHWLIYGGTLYVIQMWLVVWLILGCFVIIEVVKKKPILQIETIRGTRKIAFRGKLHHQELREFVRVVGVELGYTIESRL